MINVNVLQTVNETRPSGVGNTASLDMFLGMMVF